MVFNSTVAFRDFTPDAISLYLSNNSWRDASLATGRAAAGVPVCLVTPVRVQPPEKAASVAKVIHRFKRFIRTFVGLGANIAI